MGLRRVSFIWFWPDEVSNRLALTHDAETVAGRGFSCSLTDIDSPSSPFASLSHAFKPSKPLSGQYPSGAARSPMAMSLAGTRFNPEHNLVLGPTERGSGDC